MHIVAIVLDHSDRVSAPTCPQLLWNVWLFEEHLALVAKMTFIFCCFYFVSGVSAFYMYYPVDRWNHNFNLDCDFWRRKKRCGITGCLEMLDELNGGPGKWFGSNTKHLWLLPRWFDLQDRGPRNRRRTFVLQKNGPVMLSRWGLLWLCHKGMVHHI